MVVVMMTLFAIVIVGYVAGKMGYMGGDFDKRFFICIIQYRDDIGTVFLMKMGFDLVVQIRPSR